MTQSILLHVAVHGVAKSRTRLFDCYLGQLNNNKQLYIYIMRKNYEIGMNLCVKT